MQSYINAPFSFKVHKVLRYFRLYGLSRTLIKVRGQIHMKQTYGILPKCHTNSNRRQIVGIIGCGNYAFCNIAYFLNRSFGHIIKGVMDVDINKAASLFQYYHCSYYTDDADTLINDKDIKLIYIASHHSSHAEYAIRALQNNKSVYIEKPHVMNEEQIKQLASAMKTSSGKVFLGFTRQESRFFSIIKDFLSKESGPAMHNWFVVGHKIEPDHWYMQPSEGGRILGNFCHWTSITCSIISKEIYPVEINPTKGDRSDANIVVTYRFSDGTLVSITFSEKEESFEGVREIFTVHKGNCLINMKDYQRLDVEVKNWKKTYKNFYRDQGHKANITSAYEFVKNNLAYDKKNNNEYIINTAMLFLKTKEALENNKKIILDYCTSEDI